MNTKQLQYVLTLSRVGNFSGAAEELGISQPSLSQYVKKIEQELGCELFRRTGSVLRLTPAGEVYLDAGRRMLDTEKQMLARLDDLADNRTGVLTIGAAPFRTSSILPRAIARFREEYPGITVRVVEQTTAELKTGAARGDFDLCLCTLPIDGDLFVWEHVTAEDLVLAVPEAFPVNRTLAEYGDEPVPFCAVAGVPFVSVGEEQILGKALAGLAERAGVSLVRAAICINVDSCLAMTEAGIGAALLPRYLTEGKPTLSVYRLAEKTDEREVTVFRRRDAYESAPMKTMISILKNL